MSVINATPLLAAAGGDYQISRSVRLRSSASAYFNRTPASAGNRQIMTFSWWMKLGNTAGAVFGAPSTTNPRMQIYYNGPSDGRFELYQSDGGGSQVCYTLPSARYRDPSAWYHFIIAIDTTQATAANRIKWYVNGVQLTAFDTAAYPAQNTNMEWNAAAIHNIGRQPNGGSYFDGYLTEINFIDGQALTPSSFGEFDAITGVWKPKKYAGTYGTNGFYLNFSDNSAATAAAIGKDYSGNGNNWTPNNISVTAGVTYDSMLDVPTLYADGGNGRGNYCTLLPTAAGSYVTMSNGNLTVTGNTATNSAVTLSSIAVATGLFYFENTITTVGGISYIGFARMNSGYSDLNNAESFTNTNNYGGVYRNGGAVFGFGKTISSTSTFTTGDVLGLALDMNNGAVYISKNGTWLNSGVPTSGASKTGALFTWTAGTQTVCPMGGGYNGSVNNFNFGQRPFAYTPPTGFKALNTQNLPEPTIKKGSSYFNAVLYTGNAGSQSITGVGFQPDLVWGKLRSTSSYHRLHDAVRGADNTLATNVTDAEVSGNGLVSFDSDGFTMDSGTNINQAYTYVAWNWKESASAGFDIVTYTGTGSNTTVAHNLGVAPKMMIVKRRNTTSDWIVWHSAFAGTEYIALNSTAAKATGATIWNSTSPTSSVFSVGTSVATNGNTDTYVNYLFAEVAGFSKFGSYTGNGSTDGPFVFCGFRPAFIMIKRTDSTGNWTIHDNERLGYNGSSASKELYPNLSNAEGSDNMDQLSNGFKLRDTYADVNASGGTYIFMAFAESPFKTSLAR